MKDCCIVMPVHKSELSNSEYVALARCYKLLSEKYDIIFVCPNGLNLRIYTEISYKYNKREQKHIEYLSFNKRFFSSLDGYHALMTNYYFWSFFLEYKYVFIYQTDCYIFRDELQYWIDKDLDQCEVIFDNHHYNGIGLRKTQTFYNFLKDHPDKVKDFLYQYWYTNNYGEDDFFTNNFAGIDYENNIYILNYDLNRFGYSKNFRKFYEEYGLPMMIHYFNGKAWISEDDIPWQKEIIGDWDLDPEGCINKEF